MNLLLLRTDNLTDKNTAVVTGRQLQHLQQVLNTTQGESIRIGLLNGRIGTAMVQEINSEQAVLHYELQQEPPCPAPFTLILCLPRPKVFRRTLQTIATLGIKELILLNSYRVEKSYWQSKWLAPEQLELQLQLGLEQAVDTGMPRITLEKRFKPFVEDRLPALLENRMGIVAHPYGQPLNQTHRQQDNHKVVIIGPEGGLIPYEIDALQQAGCEPISFGDRILRVEQAISYCLGVLS